MGRAERVSKRRTGEAPEGVCCRRLPSPQCPNSATSIGLIKLSSSVRSELKQQETCQALLQQGGTLGQKEAETEDQAGKKIDSDSENDQDSVCQVCRLGF